MGVTYCALCVSLMLSVASGLTLESDISMLNVRASVKFSDELSPTSGVSIETQFGLGYQAGLRWAIHEFPLIYTTDLPKCSQANIGSRLIDLTPLYGSPSISGIHQDSSNTLRLTGPQGIAGRTLVISDANGAVMVCATIQTPNSPMASVTLTGLIAGTVEVRGVATGHVTIMTDLFFPSAVVDRNYVLALYQLGSSTAPCASLINGLGPVAVGTRNNRMKTLRVVNNLSFSQITSNTAFGVASANFPPICSPVNIVESKTIVTRLNQNNIKGQLTFTQSSPYDPTIVSIDVSSPVLQAGGFHVHQWPLPYQFSSEDTVCSPASVGGHYNPLGAIIPTPTGSVTEDMFEIGDLSGKFGSLGGNPSVVRMFLRDWNLPLFGRFSVIGRSVVIHQVGDGARIACGDVGYPGEVITAEAVLTWPVIGRVLMRQEAGKPWADTSVFVELSHTTGSATTEGHGIHVHTSRVNGDGLVADGRCSSTGGHYNPLNIPQQGYSESCGPQSPRRCEVGDISSKHGAVTVAEDGATRRVLITDVMMPLSGPLSVLGRSIVLHSQVDGSRLACADLLSRHEVPASVSVWKGLRSSQVSGTISFLRVVNERSTRLSLALSGLNGGIGGYHVHQYPTVDSQDSASICSGASVGGHYNPLGVEGSPVTGTATHDRYEIGDLSGKFGSLSGQAGRTANYQDLNLPTRGVNGVVGRSVVLHDSTDGSRQACGDLEYTVPNEARKVEAVAEFNEDIVGTVHFSTLVYPDGSSVDTTITVDLTYADGRPATLGHNWHVHRDAVTGACSTAGPHYNPFMSPVSETRYSQFCTRSNPLYCELGDLSRKQGQYDIGGGRKTYTDVNVPLAGPFSVIGRSVVFHVESGGAPRIACADIKEPVTTPAPITAPTNQFSFLHSFPANTQFSQEDFLTHVQSVLGQSWRGDATVSQSVGVPGRSCQEVTIFFPMDTHRDQLNAFEIRESDLGRYASRNCFTSDGDVSCDAGGLILRAIAGTGKRQFVSINRGKVAGVLRCPATLVLDTNICVCNFPPRFSP